jgi:hypothetical protein
VVLVNGKVAALSRGKAREPMRKGQLVRWFVRPRGRPVELLVLARHKGEELLLHDGGAAALELAEGAYLHEGGRPASTGRRKPAPRAKARPVRRTGATRAAPRLKAARP